MPFKGNSGFSILLVPFWIIVFLFSASSVFPQSAKIDVTDIRFFNYPEYTRVVITTSEHPEYVQKRLSTPDRLYFDFNHSSIRNDVLKHMPVGTTMLKAIRASQFNEDTVRVVLDLDKIREYKIITFEDPVRIIVDVYGESVASTKKRIVLDPGHGGHDPGAVGPNGLYEKDVVLDIALKIRKILSENPKFEVFLTRDKDIFIPLEERTAIANSKNADLFVSIHANASPNRAARGIETYFLNWTDDEENLKVAARENQISLKKMKKMQKEGNELDMILESLKREAKRDGSLELANHIQQSMVMNMRKNYNNIVDLRVKWAPFYVLFGAQLPSVLAEVSFISNPVEEKLLSKDSFRDHLASALASGINKYMTGMPKGQTIASLANTVSSRN